ncbi:MAG: hypothetical protein ACM359_19470, partial [Bacillota bacterium]
LRIPVLTRKRSDAPSAPATAPTTAPAKPQLPRVDVSMRDTNQNIRLMPKDLGNADGWEVSEAGTVLMIPVSAKQVDQLIGPNATQAIVDVSIAG